jgi:hypothetical protein
MLLQKYLKLRNLLWPKIQGLEVVQLMEGKWVNDCQRILNEIKHSAKVEGSDRLDMVRTIRFTILALQRSVTGWMQWAESPDIMAQFSLDELTEINKNLADLVCAFVDYDAKITGSQEKKIEKKILKETIKKPSETKDMFYVK